MFSGPMFRWEYQAASRRRRPFVFRTLVAAVFCLVALLIGLFIFRVNPRNLSVQERITAFGIAAFIATFSVDLLLMVFFVPAFVGGSIAEERAKDTLPLLLLTRLTPLEIVLTKAVARWLSTANLVLAALPILAVSAWLAGLVFECGLALLVLASSLGFMASLAMLASAQREQVGTARAQAMAWNFGWLFVPPAFTIMPIRTGTLLGDLLDELKMLCTYIAPSSPLSLLTDTGWFRNRPGAIGLEGRVAELIGLQALFGLVALYIASGRLQARERNPNWADPTRGYRPPCGDDPVYWREYELPTRRGGGSRFALGLRYVLILIRALLITALTLLGTLLALAVPLGLLIATAHYGYAAFCELWQFGYGPSGTFEDRATFNIVIRSATGLLAFLPSLNLVSLIVGRITTEKDKKTWDALLATPLDGEEILRSKARAATHGIWQLARPLVVLWMLGIACGVVTPLGVALAAIDLVLVVWVVTALGLSLGIRPGVTSVAASRASWSTLVLFGLQTPLLWAALASPRELAVFAGWDARLRWGLVLACLMIPILTGSVAWVLTRQTLRRFDEWVGRPIVSGIAGREAMTRPPTVIAQPGMARRPGPM
jgi:hypothetical protein